MTPTPPIRPATSADLQALATLAEHTFRQAFAEDNDPTDFEAYVSDAFSEERLTRELADPTNSFLVATDRVGEDLCGYAKLRRSSAESCCRGRNPIELERIYVDHRHLGRGLGARLMEHCLALAEREGHDSVWLGVWERNARAIAFYERWGFEAVGEHDFRLGTDLQRDLVMERLFDS